MMVVGPVLMCLYLCPVTKRLRVWMSQWRMNGMTPCSAQCSYHHPTTGASTVSRWSDLLRSGARSSPAASAFFGAVKGGRAADDKGGRGGNGNAGQHTLSPLVDDSSFEWEALQQHAMAVLCSASCYAFHSIFQLWPALFGAQFSCS